MQLPGRLRSTTLGDVLGTLARAATSGTLEIVETRGRRHRVHLAAGLVTAVELDAASSSLAEILRRESRVDEDTLRRSLLRAMASHRLHGEVLVTDFSPRPRGTRQGVARCARSPHRLDVLEQLSDAQLLFRVAMRAPRGARVDSPLRPPEFLRGRRRMRDARRETERDAEVGSWARSGVRPTYAAIDPARARASSVLGVSPSADRTEIKRAYRKMALKEHPDLHPGATDAERRELEARFSALTAAYNLLVA